MPLPSSVTCSSTTSPRPPRGDGHGAGAVLQPVLDEVDEDLLELVGVDVQARQRPDLAVHPRAVVAGGADRSVTFSTMVGDVDHLAAQLQPTRVDAADVEELAQQPGHPVGVLVDGLEHLALLRVAEVVPLGEQRLREALHAGQRRAQLVAHRRHEVAAGRVEAPAPLAPPQRQDEADDPTVLPRVAGAGEHDGPHRPSAAIRVMSASAIRGSRAGSAANGRVHSHQSSPPRRRSGPPRRPAALPRRRRPGPPAGAPRSRCSGRSARRRRPRRSRPAAGRARLERGAAEFGAHARTPPRWRAAS
jgi:hypothetical protein